MTKKSNCVISQVCTDENPASQAILVNFNDGFIELSNTSDAKCYLFSDKNTRKRKALVISEGNQFYQGKFDDEACQTLLLVRRKGEPEASIIRARNCSVYRAVKTQPPKKKSSLETSLTGRASNIHELSQAFGSKRFRRATNQMMRGLKDVAANEEIIADAIAGIEVEANEIEDAFEAGSDIVKVLLPPCNRDATDVKDVYPVENFISPDELKSLRGPAKFLMENPPSSMSSGDSFMKTCFRQLGEDPPLIKVQLLMYASALVNFISTPVKDLKKKDSLEAFCKFSNQVKDSIIKEFTSGEGYSRSRPLMKRDRAICFAIIILLTIFDFKLQIEDLASWIKGCGQKKLLQLAKVVGAVPMFGKVSNKTFVLKLPLPKLPEVRAKKKKL